jgi:hypothetical protein
LSGYLPAPKVKSFRKIPHENDHLYNLILSSKTKAALPVYWQAAIVIRSAVLGDAVKRFKQLTVTTIGWSVKNRKQVIPEKPLRKTSVLSG